MLILYNHSRLSFSQYIITNDIILGLNIYYLYIKTNKKIIFLIKKFKINYFQSFHKCGSNYVIVDYKFKAEQIESS